MSKNYNLTKIRDHAFCLMQACAVLYIGVPSTYVQYVRYVIRSNFSTPNWKKIVCAVRARARVRNNTVMKHSPQSVRVILHITGYFDMITC
jgi:hypothetical protein